MREKEMKMERTVRERKRRRFLSRKGADRETRREDRNVVTKKETVGRSVGYVW